MAHNTATQPGAVAHTFRTQYPTNQDPRGDCATGLYRQKTAIKDGIARDSQLKFIRVGNCCVTLQSDTNKNTKETQAECQNESGGMEERGGACLTSVDKSSSSSSIQDGSRHCQCHHLSFLQGEKYKYIYIHIFYIQCQSPMGILAPPSWNIWLQPATNPVIPGRPRVSAVLLDRINIRLMGADGPTEACEDQQSGGGGGG